MRHDGTHIDSAHTDSTAEQVLELVRARCSAGVQAEVSVRHTASALTRFANSSIHQNVADHAAMVRLRLHLDARTAAASTTLTSPEGLTALVARTAEAVRVAPPDPGWPGLAPAAPLLGTGGFDEATAAASPAQRAGLVGGFVAEAGSPGGMPAFGYCRTVSWTESFANSAGQAVAGRTTEAAMDGLVHGAGGDGVARAATCALADLDGAALGARAAAKARAGDGPVDLPPGRYEVVLEPNAVADLLHHLAVSGFNGKAHAEGRSFVALGEAQLDPSVTLVDDPFAAGTPGFAYDGEGTPKQRLVLLAAGVSTAVAHDRRSAAQAGGGAVSTGHGVGGGGAPVPLHLALLPAEGEPGLPSPPVDPAAASLVPRVDRGLLITDLHYTRVLDPKTLVVTGLTRNGVWLIEAGKVTTPVRNLRFTQSYPQALAPGAVKGIGPVAPVLPDHWGAGWWRAPALHLASWHITGNAAG